LFDTMVKGMTEAALKWLKIAWKAQAKLAAKEAP
jgi:hypothetical protein